MDVVVVWWWRVRHARAALPCAGRMTSLWPASLSPNQPAREGAALPLCQIPPGHYYRAPSTTTTTSSSSSSTIASPLLHFSTLSPRLHPLHHLSLFLHLLPRLLQHLAHSSALLHRWTHVSFNIVPTTSCSVFSSTRCIASRHLQDFVSFQLVLLSFSSFAGANALKITPRPIFICLLLILLISALPQFETSHFFLFYS